jgi:ketosteroid isomerase-like protein
MKKLILDTAKEAGIAFYQAFESGDIETMMSVWAEDDDVVCIHPAGPVLRGLIEIRHSWQSIFMETPRIEIVIEEQHCSIHDDLAVFVVHELIHVNNQPPRTVVVATNVFRREDSGWRMILHHASPGIKAEITAEVLH